MARGWESKSIEMQIEEKSQPEHRGPNTLEDAARLREIELLRLSRARLVSEISAATSPRLQQLKKRALAHVDFRLNELERT